MIPVVPSEAHLQQHWIGAHKATSTKPMPDRFCEPAAGCLEVKSSRLTVPQLKKQRDWQ